MAAARASCARNASASLAAVRPGAAPLLTLGRMRRMHQRNHSWGGLQSLAQDGEHADEPGKESPQISPSSPPEVHWFEAGDDAMGGSMNMREQGAPAEPPMQHTIMMLSGSRPRLARVPSRTRRVPLPVTRILLPVTLILLPATVCFCARPLFYSPRPIFYSPCPYFTRAGGTRRRVTRTRASAGRLFLPRRRRGGKPHVYAVALPSSSRPQGVVGPIGSAHARGRAREGCAR